MKVFVLDRSSIKPYAAECEVPEELILKKGEPGALINIKQGGAAVDTVYGVPAVGAPDTALYDRYFTTKGAFKPGFEGYKLEDFLAELEDPQINPLMSDTDKYAVYNDRLLNNKWGLINDVYGDQYRFVIADQKLKIMGEKVTRLFKPSTDPQTYPERAYEFDVTKSATVYITVPGESGYIEGLNKGWQYEKSANYAVQHAGYKTVITRDKSGTRCRLNFPTGQKQISPFAQHNAAYFKHVNAGEHVEIPVYATGSANSSYYATQVYVIWDDCNAEKEVFGANYVLGGKTFAVDDFDTKKAEYIIELESGTSDIPELEMIATAGANAQVTADKGFDENGCMKIEAVVETEDGTVKTYIFNFYIRPEDGKDTRLKEIKLDGTLIKDFNMYRLEYTAEVPYDYPAVTAVTADSAARMEIVRPTAENNGMCTITVTSRDGEVVKIYRVNVKRLGYTATEAEILDKKDGADAIVVLIHDDGNLTVGQWLADEFDKYELQGSVAMIASWLNSNNIPQWQALFDRGRLNVACHTETHKFFGVTDEEHDVVLDDGTKLHIPAGMMTAEIVGSQQHLREAFPGQRVLAFCHAGFGRILNPDGTYTQISDTAYKMLEKYYVGARSNFGVDSLTLWPRTQWYKINYQSDQFDSYSSSGTKTYDSKQYVESAIRDKGFILHFWHGIDDTQIANSQETRKTSVDGLLQFVSEKQKEGVVWNPFFEQALQYGREYCDIKENGVCELRRYDENKLAVYLSDTLDDSMFDFPVTAKVPVDDSWTRVKQVHNGTETVLDTFVENGQRYVYVNTVPDRGEAVLTKAN